MKKSTTPSKATKPGSHLFVSDMKGNLKDFNPNTHELQRDYGSIHHGAIIAIQADPNGKFLLTSDDDGELQMHNCLHYGL